MDINEQIFLVFEGVMGFHCNRKKEVATEWEQLIFQEKMPFRSFKKNFGLILNSFYTIPKKCRIFAD